MSASWISKEGANRGTAGLTGCHSSLGNGIDGFLLPSRVFRTGDVYSLMQGTHRIADLKLGLLARKPSSPVTEFNDCCAFLALVMMLIDVGAGTVDSALVHVHAPQGGQGVLTFNSSRVEANDAMNPHRSRVEWLQSLMPRRPEHADAVDYLAAIGKPTDRLRPIPESVRDYLGGYEI